MFRCSISDVPFPTQIARGYQSLMWALTKRCCSCTRPQPEFLRVGNRALFGNLLECVGMFWNLDRKEKANL